MGIKTDAQLEIRSIVSSSLSVHTSAWKIIKWNFVISTEYLLLRLEI